MKKLIGGAVILGVAVAAVLWFLGWFAQPLDEERPAMIVKNGSITFENEGRQVDWEEDGAGWHPDQPKGKLIRHFVAELKNAEPGCATIQGSHLVIAFSNGAAVEKFNVFVAGRKPKITPKLLTHANMMLSYGVEKMGQITSVSLLQGGKTCTFPDRTGEIWIRFEYE